EEDFLASENDLLYALALVLRQRRESLALTQAELAERTGFHRSYIAGIELGARNLSVRNLSRLSEWLEFSATEAVFRAERRLTKRGALRAIRKNAVKRSAEEKRVNCLE